MKGEHGDFYPISHASEVLGVEILGMVCLSAATAFMFSVVCYTYFVIVKSVYFS